MQVRTPEISARHCEWRRTGDRVFLRDLGSSNGTWLRNRRLPLMAWTEITQDDEDAIRLGSLPLRIVKALFQSRRRLDLETTGLHFSVGQRKLCQGAYLRAEHGSFTVIMGPAGCGKSLMLSLLNGYRVPDQGQVVLGGTHDLYARLEEVQGDVGFVPQASVLLPELTVGESLDFRLRLRYPDMTLEIRQWRIRRACSRMGVQGDKLDKFLAKRIGSEEQAGAVLSGGERRQANIAHELVWEPLVLILDEPTSGLASVDAAEIIDLLTDLARSDQLTVLATIHQPNGTAFGRFDNLLIMGYEGVPLFHGRREDALDYVAAVTGEDMGGDDPAHVLLSAVMKDDDPTKGGRKLRQAMPRAGRPGTGSRLFSPLQPVLPQPQERTILGSGPRILAWPGKFLRDTATQLQRGWRVLRGDPQSFFFSLAQAPVIALLVLLALAATVDLHLPADRSLRMMAHFQSIHEASGEAPHPDDMRAADAAARAEETMADPIYLSAAGARQRAMPLFVVVLAVLWFGVMGGAKEIVTERHIIEREFHAGCGLAACIAAKFLLLAAIMAVQAALLLVPLALLMREVTLAQCLPLWLVLWTCGTAGAGLGLVVSACTRSYRATLALVPLVVIPQVLFGGLLRPLDPAMPANRVPAALSHFSLQRWGFEAALATDRWAGGRVLELADAPKIDSRAAGWAAIMKDALRVRETSSVALFFGDKNGRRMQFPLWVLGSSSVALTLAAGLILRRRFRT